MSEIEGKAGFPESGVAETAARPLTAHEQRVEQDIKQILEMLHAIGAVQRAEQNERRALRDSLYTLRDRCDRLAERIAALPARSEVDVLRVEMARLGESLSGLRHALGETNRQLERHREHTLEQYDLLGGRIRDLEVARNGNGSGNGHDPAPAEDAE